MKITDLPAESLEPVKHIVASLGDVELPNPTGWHVLVMQYVRPEKVGSLFMSDQTKQEDKYQGRYGIVLALGPEAYADKQKFGEAWCKPGDWIAWPAIEGAARRFSYGKDVVLALVNDDSVLATGIDPLRAVTSG